MPHAKLVGPQARSASPGAASGSGASRERSLPEDLLRAASLRLGVLALLTAALWLIASLLAHLAARSVLPPGDPRWREFAAPDWIGVVGIAISLALFAYTRREHRNPKRILDLGLGYLIVMALALGLTFHWDSHFGDLPILPEISWIGAMVLIFAAIVPNAPARVLVAGLIAVSMNPVGMLMARARGLWHFHAASDAILMHYPDYLLVGVAVVIAHVVTKLGQQVTRAREMGSYRLGDLLGRGGMGEVYRATHRMLARPAAIKLIRPESLGAAGPDAAKLAVTRFRREAEAAASLRSPHTVELYDFGVTEDGTLYFVMELLDGMDLATLVHDHGPVPASRAIFILRQACDSLEEAHVRGLVHRDVKPANIHVGRFGLRHDWVKVLDFGLVKTLSADANASGDHSMATAAGLMPGTPAFMAPEMALGEAVDGRADLYALGCVAYWLLTGRNVFEADNSLQMIARHMNAEPEPPSRFAPVPPALDALVLRCLAKSPADRPRDAGELRRALDTLDAPELTADPWTEELAARWWATRPPSGTGAEPREVSDTPMLLTVM